MSNFQIDAKLNSLTEARKCTDVIYLIIFIVLNLGFAAVWAYVYKEGDFERLLHWYDFRGELWGVGDLSGKEYTYWPEPKVSTDLSICTVGCPGNTAVNGICLYETDHTTETDVCYTAYPSTPFGKFWLPSSSDTREDITELIFQSSNVITMRVFGSILQAWDLILFGAAISLAFALAFLIFFRFPSIIPVILAIWSCLVVVLLGAIAYFVYNEADRVYDLVNDDTDNVNVEGTDDNVNSEGYRILSYFIIAVAVILVIIIIILLVNLIGTLQILRTSARPLKNIPVLLLIPFITLTVCSVIFFVLISSLMAITTVGNIDTITYEGEIPGDEVKVIHYHTNTRWLMLVIIPTCFWWMSLLATITEYIVGSSASQWFFAKDNTQYRFSMEKVLSPLIKYHLGSIMLASVLIPLYRIPREMLAWCKGCCSTNEENKNCLSKTLSCYFDWYTRHIRYQTSESLIILSIFGSPYTISAQKAYWLKKRNVQNIGQLSAAGNYTIWLFQIVIALISPAFVLFWIQHESKTLTGLLTDDITTALAPAFCGLILSSTIGQIVAGVFRGCINSSVVCFLLDHEQFADSQGYESANGKKSMEGDPITSFLPVDPGEYDVTPPIHLPEFDSELKYAEGMHNVSPRGEVHIQPEYFTPTPVEQSIKSVNDKISQAGESYDKQEAPPSLGKKFPTVKFASHLKTKSITRKRSLY